MSRMSRRRLEQLRGGLLMRPPADKPPEPPLTSGNCDFQPFVPEFYERMGLEVWKNLPQTEVVACLDACSIGIILETYDRMKTEKGSRNMSGARCV